MVESGAGGVELKEPGDGGIGIWVISSYTVTKANFNYFVLIQPC
jgi:hypothetical protein